MLLLQAHLQHSAPLPGSLQRLSEAAQQPFSRLHKAVMHYRYWAASSRSLGRRGSKQLGVPLCSLEVRLDISLGYESTCQCPCVLGLTADISCLTCRLLDELQT